ncbi:MAG TPA: SRPBCC family protein [Candidatus Fimivicinus intestinavium]|nr:SRPBCC family protein [Candidatus Fimivicinus intestinavium]
MAVSKITVVFPYSVETLWDIVTNLEDTSWRSDLSKVEILSETCFIEYTKSGYSTRFTVTANKPLHLWEFDMENRNMVGHWSGLFTAVDEGVRVTFTEQVEAKRRWMKPFVPGYLKRQQALYIANLWRKLSE